MKKPCVYLQSRTIHFCSHECQFNWLKSSLWVPDADQPQLNMPDRGNRGTVVIEGERTSCVIGTCGDYIPGTRCEECSQIFTKINPVEVASKLWRRDLSSDGDDIPISAGFRFTEEGDWEGVWCEVVVNEDGTVNLHLNNLEFERARSIIKEFGWP